MRLENRLPTLKRVLMRLNEILELAVCAGLLGFNPCRRLSKVFARHTPINRPYIEASRLGELFALLCGQPLWFHCYVLFAVYSMLRPIEVSSIRTQWICTDILQMPPDIMKKRRAHRVPLCEPVLKLIRLTRRLHTHRSVYLFAFGRGGAHINKQHLSKFLEHSALRGKLCHHGLRATGRTWMRDEGVAHEIAEDALAHVSGSATERAYLRGDYLEQRREIMQKWWTYIFNLYCAACADDVVGRRLIRAIKR
jgi:integrase